MKKKWTVDVTFEWMFGFAVAYDKVDGDWAIVLPFCLIEITNWEI